MKGEEIAYNILKGEELASIIMNRTEQIKGADRIEHI
jgi:hypothetical protein